MRGGDRLTTTATITVDELYDLEDDPHEIANLAEEPGYEDMVNRFVEKLKKFQERPATRGGTSGFTSRTHLAEREQRRKCRGVISTGIDRYRQEGTLK